MNSNLEKLGAALGLTIALSLVAPAHAYLDNEVDYLVTMERVNQGAYTNLELQSTLEFGKAVCRELRSGTHEDLIIKAIGESSTSWRMAELLGLSYVVATHTLCPEQGRFPGIGSGDFGEG